MLNSRTNIAPATASKAPAKASAKKSPAVIPKAPEVSLLSVPAPVKASAPVTPKVPAPVTPKVPAPVKASAVTPKVPAPVKASAVTPKVPAPVTPKVPAPVKASAVTPKAAPKAAPKATAKAASKVPKVPKFTLREHQVEWAARAIEILSHHYYYIDTSQPRSGKSYLALYIAKMFNVPVLIVAPPATHGGWAQALEVTGVECIEILSYQRLAGTINKGVSHIYLDTDVVNHGGKDEIVYTASKKFVKLIEQGIFVIFDEMHKFKNDNNNSAAVSACAQAITYSDKHMSRFALLSGTPFDKVENSVVLLHTLGIISSCHLIDNIFGDLTYRSLADAITYFTFLDAETANALIEQYPIASAEDARNLVFHFYTDILMPEVCGSMALTEEVRSLMEYTNTFFKISPSQRTKVQAALTVLNKVVDDVESDRKKGKVKSGRLNAGTLAMQAVNDAMYALESAKLYDMIRVTRTVLAHCKNIKVVIALQRRDNMDRLVRALEKDFGAKQIHGDIRFSERTDRAREFNEDPLVRVMIINQTLCEGFSLYPINVAEDRLMLISPSFQFLSIVQAAARICGTGMIGRAYVKIFYADVDGTGDAIEKKNIDRIYSLNSSKANTLGKAVDQTSRDAQVLPNQYYDETEDAYFGTFMELSETVPTEPVVEETEQPNIIIITVTEDREERDDRSRNDTDRVEIMD